MLIVFEIIGKTTMILHPTLYQASLQELLPLNCLPRVDWQALAYTEAWEVRFQIGTSLILLKSQMTLAYEKEEKDRGI